MRFRLKLVLLLPLLCFQALSTYADNYPKNLNIDILHYTFELKLSDATDEIWGVTTIRVLFKKEGIDKLRLDLVKANEALQGKGMTVESIMQQGKTLAYSHADNVLWISLPQPSNANCESQLVITYHGIPADGLRIGPTKYGDRSFFNENWPNRARHWLPTVEKK